MRNHIGWLSVLALMACGDGSTPPPAPPDLSYVDYVVPPDLAYVDYVVPPDLAYVDHAVPPDLLSTDGLPDLAVVIFKLVPGGYTVVKMTNKSDGCQIDDPMDPVLGSTFTLTNDGMGNIELQGWGKGVVAWNKGTLASSGHYGPVSLCEYDYNVTVLVTVVADNTFTGDYTETHTNRKTECLPKVGATCTTRWTMELRKP